MAKNSVTPQFQPQFTRGGGEYQLAAKDRATILDGSDSAMQAKEIERQRQSFIRLNGSDMPDIPNLLAHEAMHE